MKRQIVRVKICGITNWRDAKTAIDSGADALGFNFYGKSPRMISVSHAREIVRRMPKRVAALGVFVNASVQEIVRIAEAAKLNAAQLHGDENPQTVARLARILPVIKAFRVRSGFRASDLRKYPDAAGFLLDGFDPSAIGGTGKKFDWRVARQARRYGPVILAGGITAQNVAAAIRRAQPFAVDVCSGVEASPGKKNATKVREFLGAVKGKRRKRI